MITKERVLRWLGYSALWVLISLLLATEVYFNLRVSTPDVSFWSVLESQVYRALLWAAIVPVVVWLKTVVPLNRWRWVGGVAFHLGISFSLMAGYYLARIFLTMVSMHEPLERFWAEAWANFYGRNLIDMAFYWAVIGIVYAVRMREKYQRQSLHAAQLESKLIESELRALKHQLNPHFLFNTLNTVAVLVREARNDEAVTLIARLSTLLRMTLDHSRAQAVTLRQELDFLTRYLEIQQARFGQKLTYRTETEPAALDAVIPNLILQPVVENAILHGIAQKTTPGSVTIAARVNGARLEIDVADDGPGFPAAHVRPTREGIGLANTRVRLDRFYGRDHQMVVRSEQGRGVTVSFRLPLRTLPISNPAQP